MFIISLSRRNVLCVGRHSLARKRPKPSVALVAALVPAAVFFAVSADVHPRVAHVEAQPVISEAVCCVEIVAAVSNRPSKGFADGQPVAASRYHTRSSFLTVGVAPE